MELSSIIPEEECGVDLSRFPLIVSSTAGGVTDASLQRRFKVLAEVFRTRPEPYINIIDARTGPPLSAAHRRMLADFSKEHETHSRLYCRGVAFVFESAITRGVMTAIFWARPAKVPNKVFKDFEEACAWGMGLIARETGAAVSEPEPLQLSAPAVPENDLLTVDLPALAGELRDLQAAVLTAEDPDMRTVGVLTAAQRTADEGDLEETTKRVNANAIALLAIADEDTAPQLMELVRKAVGA